MEARPTELAAPPMDDATKPLMRMSPPEEHVETDDYDPAADYRALSTPAVASLVLGLLSGLAFLDWSLGLIPLAGILLGIAALRKIRRAPDEYTGRWLAISGIALAIVFWIGGVGSLGYIAATECPPGYDPISYVALQPVSGEPIGQVPSDAMALDGKKVFIKGYVYPGTRQYGITQFLLVRDQGSCCFGGNPKITDRIEVSLADENGFTFSNGLFKVAGVFHVTPSSQAIDAGGRVFYRLDEAMLR